MITVLCNHARGKTPPCEETMGKKQSKNFLIPAPELTTAWEHTA